MEGVDNVQGPQVSMGLLQRLTEYVWDFGSDYHVMEGLTFSFNSFYCIDSVKRQQEKVSHIGPVPYVA